MFLPVTPMGTEDRKVKKSGLASALHEQSLEETKIRHM